MQNRSLFLFGAVICAVYMTVSVDCHGGGGGGDKAKWMEKMSKCGDGKVKMEDTMKHKMECKKEMTKKKPAEEEESMERRRRSPSEAGGKHSKGKGGRGGKGGRHGKKLPMAVCAMKKDGVLNQDDGKFNEDGCRKYVDAVYPESKRDTAFEKMKACADDHSSTFSEENECGGYKEFFTCAWKAHMEVCEIEMPNWGGKGGKGKGKKPQQQDEDEDME